MISDRLTEKYESYTTVIPVYFKETARNLKKCVDSVYSQTVLPEEVFLVCDGPLTQELDEAIICLSKKYGSFRVYRLDENKGAAVAFQKGMDLSHTDLIEKFGSDDVCRPCRAELLLNEFAEDPKLAVVGGYMQMYREDAGDCGDIRVVPSTPESIVKFSKRRNPFNDTTVILRKSAANVVGGYDPSMIRAQDYELYTRIIHSGYRVKNIPIVLCDAQEDEKAILRRKTWIHTRCFVKVRWRIFRNGFSGLLDFLVPCVLQLFIMILPASVCLSSYRIHLRKQKGICNDD